MRSDNALFPGNGVSFDETEMELHLEKEIRSLFAHEKSRTRFHPQKIDNDAPVEEKEDDTLKRKKNL
jgi:hypothetical protein